MCALRTTVPTDGFCKGGRLIVVSECDVVGVKNAKAEKER
jgi:hypothetical protein